MYFFNKNNIKLFIYLKKYVKNSEKKNISFGFFFVFLVFYI